MRCEEVREHVADYLAQDLPPSVRCAVSEHLASCDACREELQGMSTLWSDLAAIPVPQADHASMRRRFDTAVNAHQLPTTHAQTRIHPQLGKGRFGMLLRPVTVITMALTLLVGAGLFFKRCELALACPIQRIDYLTSTAPAASGGGHIRGSSAAAVTLVEFGDLECPPCASYQPILMKLLQEHPEKVKLEFHHFPITTIHPNAFAAAVAAEAAGDQGRYWAMHDLLLSTQKEWSHKPDAETIFKGLASQLGLDADQFTRSLRAPETQQRVSDDIARGHDAQIKATPTFFINGKKVSEATQSVTGFLDLIDAEMRGAK